MFAFPKTTEFGRPIAKAKIFAAAKASKRIRELFASQVEAIVWRHKLSPETLNLPGRKGVNEIQVIELILRVPDTDDGIVQTIDKAVPFPIAFQLVYLDQVRFAMSYKRPSEADASKWVIEGLFQTSPQPVDAPRPPLPVALDLAGLYEQILRCHIPLAARPGESIAEQVARYNALQAKKKAQQQLQARLEQEVQFNRKVELNAELRTITAELAFLQT
jgi:hypothetical protein